jgi:hypothetical protein
MTTDINLTVTTLDESDPAVLLLHYPTQTNAQPCFVELNCEAEELCADVRGEIGSNSPERVFHRRTLRWTIPCLTARAANKLLAEIEPHAVTILRGYESVYSRDGSKHGEYTPEAWEAIERVNQLCDVSRFHEDERVNAWDASDYYGSIGGDDAQARDVKITADTTDAQISTRAAELCDEAHSDSPPVYLRHANVANYLRNLRDRLADARNEVA